MWKWITENVDLLAKTLLGLSVIALSLWKFGHRAKIGWRNVMAVLNLSDILQTSLKSIDDKLVAVSSRIDSLEKEIKPDNGASFRDMANRMDNRIVRLELVSLAQLDQSSVPVFRSDHTGQWTWVNRAYLKITDTVTSNVLGNGWLTCVHFDDRDDVYHEWTQSISQERDFSMTFRLQSPGRPVVNVHCQASVLRDGARVVGRLGSFGVL